MARQIHLPELESVNRISNLPIVETGLNFAERLYNRIKDSNSLLFWTLAQAETSFYTAVDTASPAVFMLQGPLNAIDKIVCRSLDIVEQRVPQINLPPQMIYFNTKQYVSEVGTKIVRPVLKRADSVKQIGNSVLASKYTTFAADKLDGALNVADKYVDKYLPAEAFDNQRNDDGAPKVVEGPTGKAMQTFQHVDRFSRKLQRRLTRRTLAEAKALKEQGAEAIHVLIYVAELVATDPKLALQKGRELWLNLSKDEPENQARPDNLEQLIVMLTREAARRIVHFVNFTSMGISRFPNHLTNSVAKVTNKCIQIVETLLKLPLTVCSTCSRNNNVPHVALSNALRIQMILTVHMEGMRQTFVDGAKAGSERLTSMLKLLNTYTTDLLEHLAQILAGQKHKSSNQLEPKSPNSSMNQNYQIRSTTPSDSLHPPAPRMQLRAARRHVNNSGLVNGVEATS